jgi:hypothetical protein
VAKKPAKPKKKTKKAVKKKSNAGRPTIYRPEFCQALIEHMEKGYSFETFGAAIKVSRSVTYEWAKNHPEFMEAKKVGVEYSQLFWERIGIQGTVGNLSGFSCSAWIFNMKNRYNWQDRKEDKDQKAIQSVRIELPGSNTEQVITMEPKQIEGDK